MPISISRLRILTGAVVIAAAGGSGYFMQTGQTSAPGVAASFAGTGLDMAQQETALVAEPVSEPVSDLGPVAPIEPETMAIPLVTRDLSQPVLATPTSPPAIQAAPGPDVILLAAAEPAENIGPAGPEPVLVTPSVAKGCEVGFTATAAPGAMVELTLEAPCYAGEPVDIFHAGIRFGAVLDENGLTEVSVPALEEDALFNALFTDGRTEATDILMLTVSDYQRVALFWKGTTGLSLYALENGAEYGSDGMVSAAQPFTPDRATAGEGGYLARLGVDGGYQAVVYSWPLRLGDTGPAPEISVEAEVLPETCGNEIIGSVLTTKPRGTPEIEPLFMAVPACDTIGTYLVLKNLPQAVRIASN